MVNDGYRFIRLRTNQSRRLHDLLGYQFVFYQPRDQLPGAYQGFGTLYEVTPIEGTPFVLLEFANLELFEDAVSLSHLYEASGSRALDWYEHAPLIQKLPAEFEEVLWAERRSEHSFSETTDSTTDPLGKSPNLAERRVQLRDPYLRFDMLSIYGPTCVFTGQNHTGILLGRYATQIGHIVPLRNGGPDEITNVLPMSPIANWLWDEGVIALSIDGTIAVHETACPDTQKLVRSGRKIAFKDPRIWPRPEYITWHREHIYGRGPAYAQTWNS